MSFNATVTLSIFLLTIVGLIRFQNKPAYVFVAALIILYVFNFVDSVQLVASVANPGLLTLVMLMIASLALEKTRLLRLIAQKVIKPSYSSTWLRLFGITVFSSALLNNSAVVSTMLAPIRNNQYHSASRLLLPLSFAAILGGTLTLVGTSTNLIVNSLVIDAGMPALGFFDFTVVGSLLCLFCGLVLFLVSDKLPNSRMEKVTVKDYLIDVKVNETSKLIGRTVEQNGLRNLESLFLVEVLRSGRLISPVSPYEVLQAHDRLILSGDVTKVMQLNQFDGLSLFANENGLPIDNMTEVVIRHESVLVGKTLKHAGFRALFDAAVVAIKRDGEKVSGKLGDIVLQVGDYLVLAVGEDFSRRKNITKNFIVISGVEPEVSLTGWREWLASGGFFLAIGIAALGFVSLFKSMFIFLAILIATKCLTVNEVSQRLPRTIWAIIASALLLSKALTSSGVLTYFAQFLQQESGGITPIVGLVITYVITWLLTELVTNNAAAALIFPIALSIAQSCNADPKAFVLAVAFGASASFISPYGYQTNLMVFNAGHYCLKDFIRSGLPVTIVYGFTVVISLSYLYF